jgi:hypothetical protein
MASVNLSPLFNGQTLFGATGNILAGGQIYTYQAGSSTPLATYTTSNGNIANQNPIILGSDGKLPNELWLQAGYSYKFVVEDSNSVLVDTYDNIAGILTTIPSTNQVVPSGCILIWSGATGSIPTGFVICDGTNGTPDLRDKFVIGAGLSYSVGQTGGSADAIVVTHNHTATSSVTDPGHTHSNVLTDNGHQHQNPNLYGPVGAEHYGSGSGDFAYNITETSLNTTGISVSINSATTGISVSTTTQNAGQTGTNANLPPYYALAFIMKS